MRARMVRLPLLVALCCVSRGATQADDKPPASILSPKPHDKVERFFELSGKVLMRGWPVVLIRADQPESPWWVQAPIQATSPGQFSAAVRFGNEESPPGREFRVVVLMARSAEEAAQLKTGDSISELNPEIPRSEEVAVVLVQPERRAELGDAIQTPKSDAKVRREGIVRGIIKKEGVPIVFVRSAQPDNPWWVQKTTRSENGEFIATTRFGNETTPDGSLFRVVVMLATEEQAKSYPVGHTLKSLPKDMPSAKEVHVMLDRSAEPARPAESGGPAESSAPAESAPTTAAAPIKAGAP